MSDKLKNSWWDVTCNAPRLRPRDVSGWPCQMVTTVKTQSLPQAVAEMVTDVENYCSSHPIDFIEVTARRSVDKKSWVVNAVWLSRGEKG